MSHRSVVCDYEKCIGCGLCELVCSAEKERVFNPSLSRIHVVNIRSAHAFENMSLTCRLCEVPSCVASCPRKALRANERTGTISVNDSKCDGCSWCFNACDFGAILFHPARRTVRICDLCDGDAKCVKFCPTRALQLITPNQVSTKMRKRAVEKRRMSLLSRV